MTTIYGLTEAEVEMLDNPLYHVNQNGEWAVGKPEHLHLKTSYDRDSAIGRLLVAKGKAIEARGPAVHQGHDPAGCAECALAKAPRS